MNHLKRIICTIMILLFTSLTGQAYGTVQPTKVSVLIDGLPVIFDVQPSIQNGRTLVPFRAVSEALNIEVNWNGTTRTINATSKEKTIILQIGNKRASVNGVSSSLDVPPVIINGRTLIPLRFFTENLGCKVEWDQQHYTVKITSPIKEMNVIAFYALGDSKTSSWKNLFGVNYPEVNKGNTDLIKEMALGWYSMDAQGNLLNNSKTGWQRPVGWEKVLEAANTYKMNTEMVIHLPDQDSTFKQLMTNQEAVDKVINAIVTEAELYQGVNLDIEGLGWKEQGADLTAVQSNFTRFVTLLSGKLKTSQSSLTLTLHPPNSAYKGYDYEALGVVADRIIVMAYDYGSTPEPVSLVTKAIDMARANVPPEKLVLGISLPTETPESIKTKIGIAKRYKLNGIALWRLGLVSPETWESLKATVKVVK